MASLDDGELPVAMVRDLRVELRGSRADIVDGVSFELWPGEVLGLVGESGCGKTTLALTLLGHARHGTSIVSGQVVVAGHDVIAARGRELQKLRGGVVAYIPQDPPTALNPSLRIGDQLREGLDAHRADWTDEQRHSRLTEVLKDVLLPADDAFLRRYAHELSGGQQQRVAIAMAFGCRPKVIVCDEPTTGLDVTTQAQVLETIRALCRTYHVAALYVSHDLAVISSLVDRVAVMYSGRIVETGSRQQLFDNPRQPYTRRLLLAVPDLRGQREPVGIPGHAPAPGHRPVGCFFAPRCPLVADDCRQLFPSPTEVEPGHSVCCYHAAQVDAVVASATRRRPKHMHAGIVLQTKGVTASHGHREVLHDVSMTIDRHECLALVGESGSGKTTLARCIAGLHRDFTGQVLLREVSLAGSTRHRTREARREIQYVFQNPYASLNPRHTVARSVTALLQLFFGVTGREANRRVGALLELVSLPASLAASFPDQLSGGERQRVAIARALAAEPLVLICDEISSALDVSVQAAIIELLAQLQTDMGLSLLFITHNLAVIRTIADRVAVLSDGRLVEVGSTAKIFDAPQAAYTQQLLANTPTLDLGGALAPPRPH